MSVLLQAAGFGEGSGCFTWSPDQPMLLRFLSNRQTKILCGYWPECNDICSPAALHRAKVNLATQLDFVGVVERMSESVEALTKILPEFFKGASELLQSQPKMRQGSSSRAQEVSEQTRALVKALNGQDVRLYQFATTILEKKLKACRLHMTQR